MVRPPSTGNSPTEPYTQTWLAGAVSLAAAVVLGAFGAHALKDALPAERLVSFETANRYHFYSCFFLFALASLRDRLATDGAASKRLTIAQAAWGWGTVVFCGSVYLVAVRDLLGVPSASWLGAVAPLGGIGLIVGALLTASAVWGARRATR